MTKPGTVTYKVWIKHGGMMVNTEFLDWDHPMHPYNQIKAQGLDPEDYGMEHPRMREFHNRSHSSLVDEILGLRKELLAMQAAGF